MQQLQDLLQSNHYRKIAFKISKTQHILIKVSINGINGNFILDTGASNSCVGFESIEKFSLQAKKSATKASGAGATGMITKVASDNLLQIGRWKWQDFHLVVFDLSHVNNALLEYKAKPVDGIIGADVLLKGKAIIDYAGGFLYLKKL